jgi:hypothetical protein
MGNASSSRVVSDSDHKLQSQGAVNIHLFRAQNSRVADGRTSTYTASQSCLSPERDRVAAEA